MELRGIDTTRRWCPVGTIPLKGQVYRLQTSVSKDPTVGSRSNVFTSFRRLFSMELRGIGITRRRWTVVVIPLTGLEYRIKRSISKDPTVGSRSHFFTCFWRLFSMEFCGIGTTRRRLPVWAFPQKGLELRLQRSVSKDPTIGSHSNLFTCFWSLFSMELHGIGTSRRRRLVWAIPPTRPEYRLKMSVSKDLTVGLSLNFFTSFRRLFSM